MDLNELRERQSWPLEKKIDHSMLVIDTFLSRTNCNAFVSFSGGKDSTVLLDLVRHFTELAYGDANIIPAMFVNTGNEYPDIVHFVRHLKEDSGYNIEIVRPSKTPRQVWAEKGFPLIGKEQAEYIYRCRKNPNAINLINEQLSKGNTFGVVSRKWQYLIDAPYDTSQACCGLLKKAPAHAYQKRTKRFPIIGTMAEESKLRESIYIRRGGCFSFKEDGATTTMAAPLSIWTEADIWNYIKKFNLEISNIYHKGAKRTGCVGCGFGCQFKQDNRFDILYQNHPRYYEMIMGYTNHGHTYREAIRQIFDIQGKSLPDERLF